MSRLRIVFDHTVDIFAGIAIVILLATMLFISEDVVARYFFNRPSIWVELLTGVGLVYMTFLSATWILRKEGHVTVDILTSHLAPRIQALLHAITSAIGVAVFIVLFVCGIVVTWKAFAAGIMAAGTTLTMFPRGAVYLPVAIGSLPMAIQCARRAYKHFKNRRYHEVKKGA